MHVPSHPQGSVSRENPSGPPPTLLAHHKHSQLLHTSSPLAGLPKAPPYSMGIPCAHIGRSSRVVTLRGGLGRSMAWLLTPGFVTFLPPSPPRELPGGSGQSRLIYWLCSLGSGAQPLSPAPLESPPLASGGECPHQEIRLLQKAAGRLVSRNRTPPPGREDSPLIGFADLGRAGRTLPRPVKASFVRVSSVFNPWQEACRRAKLSWPNPA